MNILNIFKTLFSKQQPFNHGLAPDTRPQAEKDKDFSHDEVAGGISINWKQKDQSKWRTFTPREQNGSLSCCGQSAAKALQIIDYGGNKVWSAHPIYRRRKNYPAGGMYLQDVGEICKKFGTTEESLDPSQNLGESIMNKDVTVDTPKKVAGYVLINNYNSIDAIAEAIEISGHCLVIVNCNKQEWTDHPTYRGLPIDFGHCITAVDYFIDPVDGKKVILIEDSTGHFNTLDGKQQRIVSEDFLKARCIGGMYLIPIAPLPPRPTHLFTTVLKYGMINDEVKFLQEVLKSRGFFPSSVPSSGRFFNITQKALIDFQKAHGLNPDGIAGPDTNKQLNVA